MIHFIHKVLQLNGIVSRFFFWVIVIVVVTSCSYLVAFSAVDKKNRIEEVENNLRFGLSNQKVTLENWSLDRKEEVNLLASFPVTKERNYEIMAARFSYYHQYFKQLKAIIFVDPNGYVKIDTALDEPILDDDLVKLFDNDVGDRDYFKAAEKGETLIYHVIEKASTGDGAVVFSQPVQSEEGEFNGVILTAVHLEVINQILSETLQGETGKITFANDQGEYISELTKGYRELYVSEEDARKIDGELLHLIRKKKEGFIESVNDDGEEVFIAFTTLLDDQFVLINEMTKREVLEPHYRMVQIMFLISIVIIMIGFILFFPISKRLLNPFFYLINAINRIKGGDYNTQLEPTKFKTSPKELQHIMLVFNEMATSIQKNKIILRNLSNTDGLTGIANRRLFEERFEEAWQLNKEKQQPISLLFIDIDHFKQYNDSFGHLEGDACLIKVARGINGIVKDDSHLVARYGGEEFVILLQNVDSDEATNVALEAQQVVKDLQISRSVSDDARFVTVSVGVATMMPMETNMKEELIQLADQAVYEAKSAGRNKIIVKNLL